MTVPRSTARKPLPVPSRLGPCQCRTPLGRGAFGSVYLADMSEDRPYARAGEKVAVKVLERSTSAVDRERFRREARLGQAIEHPAVVRTYELGREIVGGRARDYLVMEYVDGRTLREVMDQLGALPESLLRALAIQIAAALDAVHRAGAVHRDLKPGNVLITREYQVKLSDLGVAALLGGHQRLTQRGMFLGTLRYAAPEQLAGETITPATDLFALGVVLYEAATTAHPLGGGGPHEMIGSRRDYVSGKVGELQPQLSPFIEEVISCLLERDPAARFASAGELLRMLRAGESSSWWRSRGRGARDGGRRPQRRRLQVTAETVFAGRETELAELEEGWRDCLESRGRLMLIEGEAGIGKSRLLDELVRRLEERGEDFRLLDGSDSPGSHFGPGSLAQAIVDHLGESELESELEALLPRARHLAAGFADFLCGLPGAGAEPLARDAAHALLRQLARALARRRPTLWLVEDLHFATVENRALLLSLAQVAERLPLMLVVTYRPELAPAEVATLAALSHARRRVLGRLTPAAGHEILERALGSFRLARQVVRRSGGNPLFLAEMIREARNATRVDGSAGGQETAEIPGSVRDLLRQRLQELGPDEQALLNAGAVQGFRFDAEILAAVRGASSLEVLERLAEIERRCGIVRGTEQGFEFDHHFLQELIYDELPPQLRRTYHRLTAEVLERRRLVPGETPSGELAAALCEHYLEGGAAAAGLRLASSTFEHLRRRNRLERLLELAELVWTAASEDPHLRCEARLQQTECFFQLGRREEEEEAATEAFTLAVAAADPSRAARARLMQGRARVDSGLAAREVLEDARARARAAGDKRTLARVLGQLGMAHLRAGRFDECLRYWQRQLALAREIGDLESTAEAGFQIGVAYLGHDRPEDGRRHLESNAELCREHGLYGLQVRAEGYLAAAWTQLGRYDRARQVFERSLEMCEKLGFLEAERVVLGNFTMMCLSEGGLEEAEELYERWRARCQPVSSPFLETYFRYTAGELARSRGDLDRARQLYAEALEICEPLAARHAMTYVLLGLGRVAFEEGETREASAAFEEVRRLVEEHRIQGFTPLVSAYLAALGEDDPEHVEGLETLQIHLRAEAHWVLYRAGARGHHLARAEGLLRRMSAHLAGRRRADFWRHHPVARAVRDDKGAAAAGPSG